jgi:hypothetical protein
MFRFPSSSSESVLSDESLAPCALLSEKTSHSTRAVSVHLSAPLPMLHIPSLILHSHLCSMLMLDWYDSPPHTAGHAMMDPISSAMRFVCRLSVARSLLVISLISPCSVFQPFLLEQKNLFR